MRSTHDNRTADNCIDDDTNTFCESDSGKGEYLEVSLGEMKNVTKIKIRTRSTNGNDVENLRATVDDRLCGNFPSSTTVDTEYTVYCPAGLSGDTVKVETVSDSGRIHFANINVSGIDCVQEE